MFDLDQFISACRAATAGSSPQKPVRELVAEAVADPTAVMKALGEPTAAGVKPIYSGEDVTIFNVVWAPLMTILPHDHRTWAVIGVYTGGEDNVYWRRVREEAGVNRIEAAGARSLRAGDVEPLGRDIVHSVTNPLSKLTAAIHVYGGDFVAIERSE